jgi:minimal PKS chain-length factor (CLF/KS beta)
VSAPVVVTGVSAVAPNGVGADAYWAATLRGESGIRRITGFDPSSYPSQVAGEISGFSAKEHLPSRLVPQTDKMTQLALAAADWALADAGLAAGELDPFQAGVVTASASGGFEFGQRELENLWRAGSKHVSAYMSFAWFYAVNSGQISIRTNMRGPTGVFVADQAGGLDAVAHGRRVLRKGQRGQRDQQGQQGQRVMVSGGVDASLCPFAWVMHLSGGRVARGGDPDRAYLPFDPAAHGHVPGEGGAILVLEPADAARERGAAKVYGEIAGHGATFDPRPGSGRPAGLRRAAETALADAGLSPSDIDVVFADAAGEPDLDQAEAGAIAELFGPRAVPTTAPKSMTGRLYSGGGPLDLVAALLTIRDGIIPATVNTTKLGLDYPIDLVLGEPRQAQVRAALVLARGAGGFNAAMVVRAPTCLS